METYTPYLGSILGFILVKVYEKQDLIQKPYWFRLLWVIIDNVFSKWRKNFSHNLFFNEIITSCRAKPHVFFGSLQKNRWWCLPVKVLVLLPKTCHTYFKSERLGHSQKALLKASTKMPENTQTFSCHDSWSNGNVVSMPYIHHIRRS